MESSLQEVRQAVVQFVPDYYRRSVNTRVPGLREICTDENVVKACGGACYPKSLEPVFPPELDGSSPLMKRVCKASHVPPPTARISKARKATEAKAKKRSKKETAKRAGLELAGVQETARHPASREDIQRSIEIQDEQERFREKSAKEDAERLRILFRDTNPKISGPIKDALGELMPEIMEHMFGTKVTVPELIEMQKAYDKAKEEGWHVEDVYEWAALSEEERKTFKELREKACDKGLPVNEYVDGLKARSGQLSGENERLSRNIERLKREEKHLSERCSRVSTWLDEDYERKEKRLEEKYLQDIDECKVEFLRFKEKLQAVKKEIQNDCRIWETKRDNLTTECGSIEKRAASIVGESNRLLDTIRGERVEAVKERDEARGELRQLRASVGPRGTVADLARQKEDLKAQLRENDEQLAEKALWLSRDFGARVEAERMVTEERENTRALAERLIEKAGDLPHLFVFLANPKAFPEEHFRELNSLVDELQVWRGYENPPSLYGNIVSRSKAPLKRIRADIEKYTE